MKNEKLINSWAKLDPGDAAKDRIFEKIVEKQKDVHPVKRPRTRSHALYASAAVLICIIASGFLLLNLKTNLEKSVDTSQSPTIDNISQSPRYDSGAAFNADSSPVTGGTLPTSPAGNSFMLLAYTLADQEGGSIGMREVDILNQPDVWAVIMTNGAGYSMSA
jgi:hypothetical protein